MPANRIAIGNGSCDILLAAGDALLEPGAELVYAWPSFSVYPHLAAASGARAIEVPLDADHRHDLEAMLARDHRRHAPGRSSATRTTRPRPRCRSTRSPAFVADVPRHVAVILDEAYCEFNLLDDPDESVELLDRHPNLVLLRTFSKIYGLCGLRVGYALCGSEEFRTAVDQVRQPFFCNAAAQAAALEALSHDDEVARRVERNLAERMELEDGLRELGLEPAESQANFVWFDLPASVAPSEARRLRGLAERGVLVRAGDAARPRGRAAGDRRHAARTSASSRRSASCCSAGTASSALPQPHWTFACAIA